MASTIKVNFPFLSDERTKKVTPVSKEEGRRNHESVEDDEEESSIENF